MGVESLATPVANMTSAAAASRGVSKTMGAGLIAGAAMGLLWYAAKRYGRDRAAEIIDWGQVSSIATRASQAPQWANAYQREAVEADYAAMLREIAPTLKEYTGSTLDLTRSA